jgi:CRISPR-associated protein Cmr2
LGGPELAAAGGPDLLVVALPGVQRFVAESRSTADVRAGSEIIAELAARAARICAAHCDETGGEMVFPAAAGPDAESGSTPNRIVALLPAGTGPQVGLAVQQGVESAWAGWVGLALGGKAGPGGGPATPGMPQVQWVSVPAGPGGYAAQWERAHRMLAARRRVRDFELSERPDWRERKLCSLSPRWPAEDGPPGLARHEKSTLSAANWVKRRWDRVRTSAEAATGETRRGFPSTSSISSAPFRQEVLGKLSDPQVSAAVGALMEAARAVSRARETPVPGLVVPAGDPGSWFASSGGPWVYPERWQPEALAKESGREPAEIDAAVTRGLAAARRLRSRMTESHGVSPPTAYLAVIAQDLDGMGRFLGGVGESAGGDRLVVAPGEHRRISAELRALAGRQTGALVNGTGLLGVPVYAGGDDLLAFVPAAKALAAAVACHDEAPVSLPTASTAVLFFHYQAGLQSALSSAKAMLDDAKRRVPGKHALAVGYLRRSGVAESSIQPWAGSAGAPAAALFALFAADAEHPLSPRLAVDLERDRGELGRLSKRDSRLYEAELGRLVRRHTGGERSGVRAAAETAARALIGLGQNEHAGGVREHDRPARPEIAAKVGVFLRQEAR